jgi:cysteine desulfurase
MGASPQEAGGALRISLGWDSRESDLTAFTEAWLQFYRRRRAAA